MSRALYTARFELHDLIERGRDSSISCAVWRAGAIVAPSSGTVSVYDAGGVAVVSAAVVTISGSVASYTVAAATTSALSLSDGWRVEWSLVFASGAYVFNNEAMLVRVAPSPMVTEADLYRRASALDPNGASPITSRTDYADQLDEAWVSLQARIIAQGKRPWLIMSPASLREPYLLLTLALIFEDLAGRLNAAYMDQAANYRQQYEQAWGALSFAYDADNDGIADAGRVAGPSSIWLSGRG